MRRHDDKCFYDLRMYPSLEMENNYTSDRPFQYATVLILCFMITATVCERPNLESSLCGTFGGRAKLGRLGMAIVVVRRFRWASSFHLHHQSDFIHFRQLVANCVTATDIMDKDPKMARNEKWNMAFSEGALANAHELTHRRATIVIQHLLQASDVSHTMQHWQVYRKWNQRLIAEMYQAYLAGRAETNPAESWH